MRHAVARNEKVASSRSSSATHRHDETRIRVGRLVSARVAVSQRASIVKASQARQHAIKLTHNRAELHASTAALTSVCFRRVGLEDVLAQALANGQHAGLLGLQARRVQLAVRTARSYRHGLLALEVGPREGRIDVLLVERQDLVVADYAGMGQIERPAELAPRELEAEREELGQHGDGVGDVDDLGEAQDLASSAHRALDTAVHTVLAVDLEGTFAEH